MYSTSYIGCPSHHLYLPRSVYMSIFDIVYRLRTVRPVPKDHAWDWVGVSVDWWCLSLRSPYTIKVQLMLL